MNLLVIATTSQFNLVCCNCCFEVFYLKFCCKSALRSVSDLVYWGGCGRDRRSERFDERYRDLRKEGCCEWMRR